MNIGPQKENGYIPIANEIAEKLARHRLSGQEHQVLWVIWRKTWGWQKKKDKIAYSQIADMTGIKRPNIVRIVRNLAKKGVVKIDTSNKQNIANSYGFNKHYSEWETVVKKHTVVTNLTIGVVKNDTSTIVKIDTHKRKKDTIIQNNKIYTPLFDYWNSLKICVHRDINKFVPSMSAALKIYNLDEIKKAMFNYNLVLKNDKYFWTYTWTLSDFLSRKNGLDKFRDENFKAEMFFKNNKDGQKNKGIVDEWLNEEEKDG